jgi:hypothetical protein
MKNINWDNELALARVNQTVNRLVAAPFSPGFIPPPKAGEVNPSLASQEPSFGKYPANLDFGDLQPKTAPDIQDAQDPGSLIVAAMCALTLFGGALVLTLFFFWCVVPAIVQGLLTLAGR